jgi:hypothetical protein
LKNLVVSVSSFLSCFASGVARQLNVSRANQMPSKKKDSRRKKSAFFAFDV